MKKNILIKILGLFMIIVLTMSVLGCGTKEQNSNQQIAGTGENKEETFETVGTFTAQDIYGNEVTEAVFSDYDITLVNMMATWCGPCVNEMPDLAQLQKDMSDKKVNIVVVVLDTGAGEEIDENAVAKAQELAEISDAEMTFMIPDSGYMNGRAANVSAVPESFFVDSNGNIVSEPYVGAKNYDKWMKIVEYELGRLQAE